MWWQWLSPLQTEWMSYSSKWQTEPSQWHEGHTCEHTMGRPRTVQSADCFCISVKDGFPNVFSHLTQSCFAAIKPMYNFEQFDMRLAFEFFVKSEFTTKCKCLKWSYIHSFCLVCNKENRGKNKCFY